MESANKHRLAVYAFLTVIWMIVIFLFSAQPAEESYRTSDLVLAFQSRYFDVFFAQLTPVIIRKAAHMAEFGLLALLVLAVFSNVGQAFARFFARINRYPASLVVTSLYAFTDELHQYFVPGRNATVMDWLFDTFGALAVLWIVYVISAKIKKRADRNRVFP